MSCRYIELCCPHYKLNQVLGGSVTQGGLCLSHDKPVKMIDLKVPEVAKAPQIFKDAGCGGWGGCACSWSGRLAARLSVLLPKMNYRVWNLAAPGKTTWNGVSGAMKQLKVFKPHVVFLDSDVNDLKFNARHWEKAIGDGSRSAINSLQKSLLDPPVQVVFSGFVSHKAALFHAPQDSLRFKELLAPGDLKGPQPSRFEGRDEDAVLMVEETRYPVARALHIPIMSSSALLVGVALNSSAWEKLSTMECVVQGWKNDPKRLRHPGSE